MANALLVLLIAAFSGPAWSKSDPFHTEGYLGEKDLSGYAERWDPILTQDIYSGGVLFSDEIFLREYFQQYIFGEEGEYTHFVKEELQAGALCSNETLSSHLDEIRYAYRLITLSYLLEGQWHMNAMAEKLRLKDTCGFNLVDWAKTCRPKSSEMKKFVERLIRFHPAYTDRIPPLVDRKLWSDHFRKGEFEWYSEYRVKDVCGGACSSESLEDNFRKVCAENKTAMDLICSEDDEIMGLSWQRDAYFLLGQSNIINTFNKNGEAMGCLRRFSEVMSHREVTYAGLKNLFPPLHSMLRAKHKERFLQGRVFFFGAGKEFEEKGLTDLYVEEQPLVVSSKEDKPEEKKPVEAKPVVVNKEPVVVAKTEPVKKPSIVEIRTPQKSAFLQAAEVRAQGNLSRVEVDMEKLRYDYIFSLNMMNNLNKRLRTFMKRDALVEMMTYDKLGTSEGPVPLLFLKFMIDLDEHQGLWNLVNVVGDRFYVSNEIDAEFKPKPELIQLQNNDATGRHWQIYIIKP